MDFWKPKIWFYYLSLSLIYFIQFPLSKSLTGNIDTIANLAMFKHLKMYIDFKIGLRDFTPQFLYPIENTWLLFGADFGSGFIHVFFNYLGFNDLWANYFYISILFSFNSYSLFLLLNFLIKNHRKFIFLLSLIFTFSHFSLGNLENPNVLIFFPSFLSILYLLKFLDINNQKYLGYSILFSGIQIYLSPTNFLMHIITFIIIFMFYESQIKIKDRFRYLTFSLLLIIVLIIPYIWYYVLKYPGIPFEKREIISKFSLNLEDFVRVLPGHLYLNAQDNYIGIESWLFKIKSAYIGVVFYVLVLISLIRVKRNMVWKLLFIVGFIISLGPIIYMNDKPILPNIIYPLFSYIDMGRYFTVPSRYFFIAIFSGVILIAHLYILSSSKYRGIILILLFFSIFENVPIKMKKYTHNYINEITIDSTLKKVLYESDFKNILFAPTFNDDISNIRQEYIYMYWQYIINKNILNGFTAVLTSEVQDLIEKRKNLTVENLNYLFLHNKLEALIVLKTIGDRKIDYQYLETEKIMIKYFENENFIIYEAKI